MLTVEQEVRRLLADMMRAAQTAQDLASERETTEIATIALSNAMPIIDDQAPGSAINLHAQAVVVRAMRQHGENLRAALVAA